MPDEDTHYKKSYTELVSGNEKDFKSTLSNLLNVFKFINERYNLGMDHANFNHELEMKLTRKEENGKIDYKNFRHRNALW
jgi:hypothetical protein